MPDTHVAQIYSTIARGAALHISLPAREQSDFEATLQRNQVEELMANLSKVNVETAQAYDPLDREMIHRTIKENLPQVSSHLSRQYLSSSVTGTPGSCRT